MEGACLLANLPAVCLDLETTGLDVATDRIVSVAAIELRGETIAGRAFDSLVSPGVPIPEIATRIHGITDAMVNDAPTFADVHERLRDIIGNRVVIGHSIGFDLAVLRNESARNSLPWVEPQWLDTGLLATVLNPALSDGGLESIASWLGVIVVDRHTAIGDATTAAAIYARLLPYLRDAGVRTLAEARRFQMTSRAVLAMQQAAGWFDASAGSGGIARTPAPTTAAFERIDSYPYRHRLAEVMAEPISVSGDISLQEAARRLHESGSAILLVDEVDARCEAGVLTEHDLVRALTEVGVEALSKPVRDRISRPIVSLPQTAFVYQAIGRMQRLAIRHLAVTNGSGEIVGTVSARRLLWGRLSHAILMGDGVMTANNPLALAAAVDELPMVAAALQAEGTPAPAIAAVISDAMRHVTARAAVLAEQQVMADGIGSAPVPWSLLILGSGGRGESLLAPDQDNAIVYRGTESDDAWFEALAQRLVDILNTAGIPYCEGQIMATNPFWRRSLAAWRDQLEVWLHMPNADALHQLNTFFDFESVHGDPRVAGELRDFAVGKVSGSVPTQTRMARMLSTLRPPIGFFGGFERDALGRLDLKPAIVPLVCAARILALIAGSNARATADRFRDAVGKELLTQAQADELIEAHGFLIDLALGQQLRDLHDGIAPSMRIDLALLDADTTRRLRRTLQSLGDIISAFPRYCGTA